MIDTGSGPPLVLVPGIQGRWEWMRPAVNALATRCRVLSSSLAGDPGSGAAIDAALGFDTFVAQIDAMRERAGLDRLALCGISFGGLIAVRYAALRPDRVTALVVVSSPGPRWRPDARVGRYVRHPLAMAPAFVAGTPRRLGREILAAAGGVWSGLRFSVRHAARVLAAPMSPTRMSQRVRMAGEVDFVSACAKVQAPTLVVTGEPGLDRVMHVESTREYAELIAGARAVTFERTGHIGLVTRPERFTEIVGGFVEEVTRREARGVRLEA